MSAEKQKKEKLEECQKKRDEYLAGWQRSQADFANYKKGEVARIGEMLQYVNSELILKIMPILDNFEKAEKEIPDIKEKDQFMEGFLQIKHQFDEFLKNQGIEGIKTVGEKFDPNFHEVVETVKMENKESGIIIKEIKKGYKLNGKVLRPAKITINQ